MTTELRGTYRLGDLMNKRLFFLPKDKLDLHWESMKPFLASGLLSTEGELTIDQVRLLLVQGYLYSVVAVDMDTDLVVGALAFEIINYPQYRVANVVSVGGDQLLIAETEMAQFQVSLKQLGCTKIQGWCSPAIARLWKQQFNARIPYQMIRIDIGGAQ